jgi:hypothetical protein
MKHMKKYQSTGEVQGSKGAKASQIIAGITGAVTGAAGIIAEAKRRKKLKKAEEEKKKMEETNNNNTMKTMRNGGTGTTNTDMVTIKKSDYPSSDAYRKAMDDVRKEGKTVYTPKEPSPASWKKMKTGGMVNANAKVKALAKAGSKGVKSNTNPKASASKKAKGRPGKSSAPKTAVPKAKYGMVMRRK